MAVTSGFFNSVNSDRKYNAEQMSTIFNGIINDGVFMNIGTAFGVKATTANRITVGIGRAWFNGTWTCNDALLSVTATAAEVLLDRIDAVVIEVNHTTSIRANSIEIIKGTPSSTPKNPTLTRNTLVNQYPLAYILRKAGATSITQADITNTVGTTECPYITGILKTVSIDDLVVQWEAQWSDKKTAYQNDFEGWFANIRNILSTDEAGRIASLLNKELSYRQITLLSTAWSSTPPYTQDVVINGLLDTDSPIVSVDVSSIISNGAAVKVMERNYGYISRAQSLAGKLRLYCANKKPSSNINILVRSAG